MITRAIHLFIRNGYKPKSLPQIYLSLEAPPVFVPYPELEEGDERENEKRPRDRRIPREEQRRRPEVISIEELLGCYIPNPKIILWVRGINWLAKRKDYDREFLQAIVLLHEIGHWITHQLPSPISPDWETELFIRSEEDVKEGWAQLITYWVVGKIGGEIKNIFEDLSISQPSPYRVYKNFVGFPVEDVINSLERLRNLKYPARLSDWEKLILMG